VPTSQQIPSADIAARIDWGDGSSSAGSVSRTGTVPGDQPLASYQIAGAHEYAKPGKYTLTITVVLPGGGSVTGSGPVNVYPYHPQAGFLINPDHAVQYGIGLLMPRNPLPGQADIRTYKWKFFSSDHNNNDLIDSRSTHAHYMHVISELLRDPSQSKVRDEADSLGILPHDQGNIFNGLTDPQVRQIARVWRDWFPKHVIPYYFDAFGDTVVQLTTTDATGKRSEAHKDLPIARNDGIAKVFGFIHALLTPRWPDYFGINFGGSVHDGLGGSLGISIEVMNPFEYPISPATIFISPHLGLGVGLGITSPSVRLGWVGWPWNKSKPSEPNLSGYMRGFWLYADFSIGLGVYGDLETVESPNRPSGYMAGFEAGAGASLANLSADASFSCAMSLQQIGIGASSGLVAQIKQLVPKSGGPLPADYKAQIGQLASSLQQSSPNIWDVALGFAKRCSP
jgi:hypothetical protein